MVVFGISILDSSLANDITVGSGIATIIDHSNYDESVPEEGHAQSDFSDYKKIYITTPANTSYLFSTLGDGDALLTTPALATLPISTVYTTVGDGVYTMVLEAVPTWGSGNTYSLTNEHHVYYGAKLYKSLQNSNLNKNPVTETTYWEEVDADDLPEKYRITKYFYCVDDLTTCFQQSGYDALCAIESMACAECILSNENYMKTSVLNTILYHLPVLASNDDWDRVATVINLGSALCACSSSSNPCNC